MNNRYPKAFSLSVALTGIFFFLITYLFSLLGVLSLSEPGLFNTQNPGLTLSLIALQFFLPALGLGLYNFLNNKFPNNSLDSFSLSLSNLVLGICVAMLFFGYLKLYTLITFLILFALLLYIEYKNKLRFMYRFYRTYATLLIPFYLLCIFIKKQSQLIFNEDATLKLNLFYLSIEVYFYFMGMLLAAIYLFEFFKSKKLGTHG
jgi:hypothetical protein